MKDKIVVLLSLLILLSGCPSFGGAAAEIDPDSASHQVLLSRVLRRAGDKKASDRALDRAIELAPDDEEVRAEQRRRAGKS